jgi:hypothetical protein
MDMAPRADGEMGRMIRSHLVEGSAANASEENTKRRVRATANDKKI